MNEVSCRNVLWLLNLCDKQNINSQLLLKNIPHNADHLVNPSNYMDWASYSNFISNFRKLLSLEDIVEASRQSWETSNLGTYALIGRILYSVTDQYIHLFGASGTIPRHFPCDMTLVPVATGHLSIELKMQDGLAPCETFHHILAGQMIGLPESLGYKSARVRFVATDCGARFEIDYDEQGGFLASLHRLVSWPLSAYRAARELSSTYKALIHAYSAIEDEASKTKAVELQLEESRKLNETLTKNLHEVLWIMDDQFNLEYLTPSIFSLCGYTAEEVLENGLLNLFTETHWGLMSSRLKNCFTEPQTSGNAEVNTEVDTKVDTEINREVFEVEIVHKDGRNVPVEISFNRAGTQFVGVMRDTSDRKSMELDLHDREDSYRIITTTAQDGILTIDENSQITFANPSCARIFGYDLSEIIGSNLIKLIPVEFREAHLDGVASYLRGDPRQTNWNERSLTGLSKNNERIPLDLSFAEYRQKGQRFFTTIIRDSRHRKQSAEERMKLEHQLLESQKMESVGQLAGGIAHDFNNLLVAILGYVDLAMDKELGGQDLDDYLSHIKHAGESAADMTQKLLAFSRKQTLNSTRMDLNDLITGMQSMIRRLIPENIEIVVTPSELPANVLVDPGQLEQVIVNLAVNARDAMQESGTLEISTSRISISADHNTRNPTVKAGEYICLNITDTGEGMSEEVASQVFEPFFTTKPEGSGTGLGLAVVFGIVKQHEGFIEVESKQSIGTTIKVCLPMSSLKAKAAEKSRPQKSASGSGTILLVEDDDHVRNLAKLILTGVGYTVTGCAGGEEALDFFTANSDTIDLVLMDVVMPRIGGREVMEKMRTIDPDMRFLFTSGYAENGIHTRFIAEKGFDFVAKPYTTESLQAKVRQVIEKDDSLISKTMNLSMRNEDFR